MNFTKEHFTRTLLLPWEVPLSGSCVGALTYTDGLVAHSTQGAMENVTRFPSSKSDRTFLEDILTFPGVSKVFSRPLAPTAHHLILHGLCF